MKAIFTVEYELRLGEFLPCSAVVSLFLPIANPEKGWIYLAPEFCSPGYVVFDHPLHAVWGDLDARYGGTRMAQKRVYGKTWEEVDEKANQLIIEATKVLHEVYEQNMKLINSRPADRRVDLNL